MTRAAIRHPGEQRWETRLLAVVTLVLVALGVMVCYAAGTYSDAWSIEAQQQISGALVGGAGFLLAARFDYRHGRRWARLMFYATLAALGVIGVVAAIWPHSPAPGIIGRTVPYLNGAHRWIRVAGVQIQFAELARFTLTVMLAAWAADLGPGVRRFRDGFVPLMVPIAATVLLVGLQPNLSMCILLGLTAMVVLFVAGARLDHMLLAGLVGSVGVAGMMLLSPERMARYTTFLTPPLECVPGEQVCNSMVGLGSGGFWGVGFGKGTQKLGHMAYGYSDFILSVFGEEWGFIGVLFLGLCFAVFCWMGFRIAVSTTDPFGRLLAAGLTAMVALAALMHAAVVMSLMPATGLTLPFISAGRLSLVVTLVSAGVLVSIGQRRGKLR
jgi:cell division protein FtsW